MSNNPLHEESPFNGYSTLGFMSYMHMSRALEVEVARIQGLEERRSKVLLKKEIDWKIKSRTSWIDTGDHNTIFFHRFGNYHKILKTIWRLKILQG